MVETVVFNGIKFRRYPDSKRLELRNYHVPNGTHRAKGVGRLHQEIWKASHGPIPEGHHVHHKDENTLNNALSNLECIPAGDHLREHMAKRDRVQMRASIRKAISLAPAWHRSPEGREWHRQHAFDMVRVPKPRVCSVCSKNYVGWATRADRKFICSPACQQKALRDRRRREDDERVAAGLQPKYRRRA